MVSIVVDYALLSKEVPFTDKGVISIEAEASHSNKWDDCTRPRQQCLVNAVHFPEESQVTTQRSSSLDKQDLANENCQESWKSLYSVIDKLLVANLKNIRDSLSH